MTIAHITTLIAVTRRICTNVGGCFSARMTRIASTIAVARVTNSGAILRRLEGKRMNDYKELIDELRSEAENMRECRHDPWTADDYDKAAAAIEQLVRERDAAVKDIGWNCIKCKHYDKASPNYGYTEECENCGTYPWFDDEAESKWEWRGVQE